MPWILEINKKVMTRKPFFGGGWRCYEVMEFMVFGIECNKFIVYSLDTDKLDIWCTIYIVVSMQYHTYTIQSHDIFATLFHGLSSISVYHIVVFGHMMYRYMCWYVSSCISMYRTCICCNLVDTPFLNLMLCKSEDGRRGARYQRWWLGREPQSVSEITISRCSQDKGGHPFKLDKNPSLRRLWIVRSDSQKGL